MNFVPKGKQQFFFFTPVFIWSLNRDLHICSQFSLDRVKVMRDSQKWDLCCNFSRGSGYCLAQAFIRGLRPKRSSDWIVKEKNVRKKKMFTTACYFFFLSLLREYWLSQYNWIIFIRLVGLTLSGRQGMEHWGQSLHQMLLEIISEQSERR